MYNNGDLYKAMQTLILVFLILFFSYPLLSQERSQFLFEKKSPEKGFTLSQSGIPDESEEDLDEDDISTTIGSKTGKDVKTKSSSKPKVPSSHNQWSKIEIPEMDPEKKKQMIKEGILSIQTHEERNNNNSVKQISRILLTNPFPEVRTEAARSLGRIGKGVKSLHKAIDSDGYEVRQEAYKSIERIGSRSSMKYFAAGVKSSDFEIKSASYKGLGKTRSSIGRDIILKQGIHEPEPAIVSAALTGLGYFSRKEDLSIFYKFLTSEVTEHKIGAIQGLGYSKLTDTIDYLLKALEINPSLEPEIIHAISQKKTLPATLTLIKLMHSSKNENYQAMIQKELYKRRAFGRYAIVKTNTASLRKSSKANSGKIAVLANGEVALIRKVTEKLFKAKMNKEVIEDRYYLLQAYYGKDSIKKGIIEGWVFGPKIDIISINDPGRSKVVASKTKSSVSSIPDESEEIFDEDSEDERNFKSSDTKTPGKDTKVSDNTKNAEPEFYDEDEDE
jgi:phosphoribosylformylglycinamidine (FGAM) synthase PurS component